MTYKFSFTPHSHPKYKFIDVRVKLNGHQRGTITLTRDEWASLCSMLNHGGTFFQDEEASIEICPEIVRIVRVRKRGRKRTSKAY